MAADPEVEAILGDLGIPIARDGTAELVHATKKEAAAAIQQSGLLHAAEGLVYFATHPAIASRIVDPADGVLKCRVTVEDLIVHRRPDELDDLDDPQAEFVVYSSGANGYTPAEVGEFIEVGRDDY